MTNTQNSGVEFHPTVTRDLIPEPAPKMKLSLLEGTREDTGDFVNIFCNGIMPKALPASIPLDGNTPGNVGQRSSGEPD